jgi:hypothetical protein
MSANPSTVSTTTTTVRIHLTNSRRFALVDSADAALILGRSWYVIYPPNSRSGYVFTWAGKRPIAMHRFILPDRAGYTIDHVNPNGLDNRRANLRYATKSQQQANRRPNLKRTRYHSGLARYKGVSRYRRHHDRQGNPYIDGYAYRAAIELGRGRGSHRYPASLGYYRTARQAALAYDRAALEKWGPEYAHLNFPTLSMRAWQRDTMATRTER